MDFTAARKALWFATYYYARQASMTNEAAIDEANKEAGNLDKSERHAFYSGLLDSDHRRKALGGMF